LTKCEWTSWVKELYVL